MALSILRKQTHFDFVGWRRIAYSASLAIVLIGVIAFFVRGGLRYGVDFSGGVAVQVQFASPVGDEAIKDALSDSNLPGLAVQQFGDGNRDYLIRFSTPDMPSESIRDTVEQALATALPDNTADIQRLEVVGPKVGEDLRNAALGAVYVAILLITVYISGRFEQRWVVAGLMTTALFGGMYVLSLLGVSMVWRVVAALVLTIVICWKLRLNFALGAVISLVHDVGLTVGLLILMDKEFDLNILAALMTLVGYSLNDTIIIFDRIRENLRKQMSKTLMPIGEIINLSCNQTLSRTILTSGTTAMAALSLFALGGGVIHDFALTMLIGVVIGTYSSIFIASPVLMVFGDTQNYMEPVKEHVYERPGEHGMV